MLTANPNVALILIVEDDNNHAELIQRSFEEAPDEYRLEFVGTICAAKRAMELNPPGLVLTDYRLPDGDGSELVMMASGLMPVIIMTSHGSEQVAVEAMKIGAQDYIVKSSETFESLPIAVKYGLITWALTSARKQAAAAALRAKKDWERTFDAVPDLISIVDMNHIIIRANKAMAVGCGLTQDELIGRKCHEVMHGFSIPHTNCPYDKMIRDGFGHTEQVEENMLNGIFDITVSPLYDNEGQLTGCVHVLRDITERKRAEAELQNIEKQFQHTQKLESLGVLSGGIAHDFNNILTIILGHCYILKENIDSDDNRESHIRLIESAANRAADLCRQMLAYAGKSPLLQSEFSLWMLVDEIVKMLTSAINKNVNIKLDMRSDIPMIVGDSSQIQQVVMNLILNAGEAIGESNGTITVSLKMLTIGTGSPEIDYFGSIIIPGSYACLDVSDTGCGMSEETRLRLFEPFYTTKFTGRGLGMSAILGIVKAHYGALQLASIQNVGTTFKVYIPLTPAKVHIDTASPIDSVEMALSKATVLLVDDENTLLIMETSLLEALGFAAITAVNGREAVEVYRTRGSEIDLVMLDLLMPEMGGIEAYHELRKIDSYVPIVICSGYSEESVADITSTDINTCFIHKPYNPGDLCRLFNEMLGE